MGDHQMMPPLAAHVLRLDHAPIADGVGALVRLTEPTIVVNPTVGTVSITPSRARVILGLDPCDVCLGSRRCPECGGPCEVCCRR
jgi:hypothetical protein